MRLGIAPSNVWLDAAPKPLLVALGLLVVLSDRLSGDRARLSQRSYRLALDAGAVELAITPGRRLSARQTAAGPIVLLALATLAVRRCEQTPWRIALLALAASIAVANGGFAFPLWRLRASFGEPWVVSGLKAALHALPAAPSPSSAARLAQSPAPVAALHPPAPVIGAVPVASAPGANAPAISDPPASPAVESPPVTAATAPAPVAAAVPAPATRVPWQPPNAARWPFPEPVEAWRPLVRQLLAEAWNEGRLDGAAAALDDDLVLALIQQESRGNPDALSPAGAIGLMQVMPFTFADMMAGTRALTCAIDRAAIWDVPSNVRAGIRYLAKAMQADEGNRYWALAAYNAGIETVADWRDAGLYAVPPMGGYTETAAYAPTILREYLSRRPDVAMHVPERMPLQHVPGAIRLLQDLASRRPLAAPPNIPRCG